MMNSNSTIDSWSYNTQFDQYIGMPWSLFYLVVWLLDFEYALLVLTLAKQLAYKATVKVLTVLVTLLTLCHAILTDYFVKPNSISCTFQKCFGICSFWCHTSQMQGCMPVLKWMFWSKMRVESQYTYIEVGLNMWMEFHCAHHVQTAVKLWNQINYISINEIWTGSTCTCVSTTMVYIVSIQCTAT